MQQPLFSAAGAFPCPLLPFDAQGTERTADGVNVLDLTQAAARWGDRDALQMLWSRTWDETMTPQAEDARMRDLAVLRRSAFGNFTDAEFQRYLTICRQHDLDPLDRPIYAVRSWNNHTKKNELSWRYPIATIRMLAYATDQVAGSDEPKLIFADDEKIPYRASVTVYRFNKKGDRVPFTAQANWSEYYPGPGTFFDEMPCLKLGYCAEAAAWRKAFPKELRNIYTPEEMRQADVALPSALSLEWDHRRQKPWPGSYFDFQLALSELGLRDETVRHRVISQLREEVGTTGTDEEFFRASLLRVYEDPAKYGVSVAVTGEIASASA